MKGKIIQDAKLYLQKEGDERIRHIKTWKVFEAICKDLGISTDYKARTFLGVLPPIGRPIKEWPEEEAKVGSMVLMYNVPELADKKRVAAMGVTHILDYGTEWMHGQGQDFLDSCLDEHGEPFIHVIYSLKSSIHDKIRAGKPWNRDSVAGLIERFNGHPAVSGWYILDEHDSRNPEISYAIQKEIVKFIRDRSDKPITWALRGGTVGWPYCDLSLIDFLITNTYPYNGSGKLWEFDEPLDGLDLVGKQQQEYLKDFPDLKTMFLIQCCDEPAVEHKPSYKNTQLPLGKVRDIWERVKPYGINTQGVGFWGYNHGYFGPESSKEMYEEVKLLIDEL